MVAEANEILILSGWPLGLENMKMRIRVRETLQATPVEANSCHPQSLSSSSPSFSSSDLDTESTRSFFPDHSITLGYLIGIKPGDNRDVYLPGSVCLEDQGTSHTQEMEVSQRMCMPMLLNVLIKIGPSRSSSRR